MKKSILIIAAAISISALTNNVFAQTMQRDTSKKTTTTTTTTTTPAAGAKADSVKDIDATIANVASLSTLEGAIKAANLSASLKDAGPFTVFAPDNDAFSAVSKTKMDSLMKDPAKLATLVNTHVVKGKFDKAGVIKALTDGKGKATLTTIDGQILTLSVKDKKLAITDSRGSTALVTSFDTPATNGIIHGINAVLQ
jgi:uncharacterized surface protein with fasciclin (FAS1) repeats